MSFEVLQPRAGSGFVDGLLPMLSLSYEHNLPTWFSSCLLFSCALALAGIARRASQDRSRDRTHWTALAVIFFYLSFDEASQVHEHLGRLFDGEGVLYFSWVIPAALIVSVVGTVYLPFLLRLPRRRRGQFIIAGVLYVSGALLMELPLGWWTERAGNDNLTYAAIDHVEEWLEMVGAAVFLAALIEEISEAAPKATERLAG